MADGASGVGARVRRLREKAGLSQEQLSKRLGTTRPAVSQIENGQRNVTADEVARLAETFGVSCDVLLGLRTEPVVILARDAGRKPAESGMRISVPQKNLRKFKEVLLYVLSRVGGKPHVGETVIYKLLYFIDFDYYEKYEEQLIGATYVRNKYGPTPVEFGKVVERMEQEDDLMRVKSKHFQYQQRKYL
ncbi:MAG: helix-turn-helix domain-containing protein, partial [candidate division WOR-3 bacterium]